MAAEDAGLRDLVTNLSSEVAELRQQNEDLFKIQQRILYIFSQYMRAAKTGQVGSGGPGGASSGAAVDNGKRIRGLQRATSDDAGPATMKRPRLLMEARPDSPPREYHSDTMYSSGGGGSGSGSSGYRDHPHSPARNQSAAAASANRDDANNVVDLNTDSYAHGYGAHSSQSDLYGSHALSDLNWSSDPVQAINDLITKSGGPLQQVLNSSNSLPMQMGRAAASSAAINAAQGQPYRVNLNADGSNGYAPFASSDMYHDGGHVPLLNGRMVPSRGAATSSRVGGVSSASAHGGDANFLDLSSQLVGTNPKQLLELLDRMGAEHSIAGESTRGGGGVRARSTIVPVPAAGRPKDDMHLTMPSSQNANYGGAISGVFEDADDDARAALTLRGGSGGQMTAATSRSMQRNDHTDSSAMSCDPIVDVSTGSPVRGSVFPPSRTGGATLSPLEEPLPSFPPLKPTTSPLHLAPLPTSPVSPFNSDSAIDAFSSTLGSTPLASHSFAPSFAELRSPSNPLVSSPDPLVLTRDISTNSVNDPLPFGIHSPYQQPSAASLPPTLDLQPLTPNQF